ncbi:MAG: TonB-dependent receptor [Bacteroidota bacterium]|jgi:iron complex outermembrane receptor protein|nr:MAG: TonB-dependent receptor [Bacteroidota bacterium]
MLRFTQTVLLALSSFAAVAQFQVTGSVRQHETHQPLGGATVQLLPGDRSAVTDSSGHFSVTNVPRGKYTLLVRYLGHSDGAIPVDVTRDINVDVVLKEAPTFTDEVVVEATRADERTPTTFVNMDRATIRGQDFGQDLPYLLNWTPSLVTTSDAGTGIGYTGVRIRGSDATRINVTINGIPYNDAESLGTFWVDIPDIASSTRSIQIQRGVGTSTNGAGAFGGTVNLQTTIGGDEPFAEATMAVGSFNTRRFTVSAGTGLINDHWSAEARLSKIQSDGYIDRAFSDLGAYYFATNYRSDRTLLSAIFFGGRETTYQSWYGIDPDMMNERRTFNYAGAIYDDDGNVIRYYDNQTDNYKQDHTQLHLSHVLSPSTTLSAALHYTFGRGYYENYNQDESFASLGLPNLVIGDSLIEAGDFATRKWLKNHFYGATFSLLHEGSNFDLTFGGGYHRFTPARHFGEIIWGEFALDQVPGQRYYEGESDKSDFNLYGKIQFHFTDRLNGFADVQWRRVAYTTSGTDDDQSAYNISDEHNFFNPKAGLSYTLDNGGVLYASYAIAHREPTRTDYLENDVRPRPERMGNLEAGFRKSTSTYHVAVNYYLMRYKDQLVLTGELDNVGDPIRANVGESYRTGIELSGGIRFSRWVDWNVNATWSRNRNVDYVWEEGDGTTRKANTAIILSPDWIAGSQLTFHPHRRVAVSLLSKYVSKQYLDNTQNEALTLDAYFVNDLRITWEFQPAGTKRVELSLLVNNLFDTEYASNGYSYDGVPYFYPQAGINFLGRVAVKL